VLNSAAAIHVAKPEVSIEEGVRIAEEVIASGKAAEQLERFIRS